MLTLSQQTLLKILGLGLQGKTYQTTEKTDWEEIFRESRLQAVAYQTLDAISPEQEMPPAVKDAWTQFAMSSMLQNLNIHSQHGYVHAKMQAAEIPYCILKGSAAASFYPTPALRAMGDVDFLVSTDALKKAEDLFTAEGFAVTREDHACHVVLNKGRKHLELHFDPAGMPKGKSGEQIRSYLETVFAQSETVTVEGFSFQRPSLFHHGLILLMHTYHHMLSEGIGLRHLCDWAVFVNHFDREEFPQLFQEKLSDCGLWRFANLLSGCAFYGFHLPMQPWMEQEEDLFIRMLEDIFSGGNFGAKAPERTDQSRFFTQRGKQGISRFPVLHFLRSMNRSACKQYPIFEKVILLRPFGWIFMGVRYLVRALQGKRKLPDREFLSQAGSRKELYQQFKLFE